MNLGDFTKFIKENNINPASLIDITAVAMGIIVSIVKGIIKLFLSISQKSKKEKVTRISKVLDIYEKHILSNYLCLAGSAVLLLPIAYLSDMVLKLSSGTFVLIASIIIIAVMFIFNLCSQKRRKQIDDSFSSRKKINKFLFYLPVLSIILEAIITLNLNYIYSNYKYNNILGIALLMAPTILVMIYFMAMKTINKYKDVDIYFKNAFQERNVSYKNYSHEDRFVVIVSDDKLTCKKYNIDYIAKIVINRVNVNDEYQKHLNKRGFVF